MNPASSRKSTNEMSRLTSPFKSARNAVPEGGKGFMRSGTSILLLIIAIIVIAVVIWLIVRSATAASQKQKKKQEDEEEFEGYEDSEKSEQPYSLTYVHMDGCSYCRKFDPVWKKLRKEHETHFKKMGVRMEDHESKSEKAQDLDVDSYPTVMLLKSGNKVATFNDERTVPNLVKFVKSNVNEKKSNK